MTDADDIAKRYERKYGHQAASSGRFQQHIESTSTGILALDYALGTGGWPEGCVIEVYGPPDIGKSSIIGFNGFVEAQKQGKMCGLVAMEPGFSPEWAEKNGVDLDRLVIVWPDEGQQAFDALYDMVMDPDIEFIVFDSIGAILRPAEAGDKGKPAQGGQSGLITWGVKRIQTPVWKRKKTVILLNQIRDDMDARIPGMVKPPGGHALGHTAEIHVQLKPGKDRYMVKVDGEDVMAGRQVVAIVKRTKRDEGTNKRAVFDHYSMETADLPFGVDRLTDVVNTAKRVGVLKMGGGGWFHHSIFPGGKIRGQAEVEKFLMNEAGSVDLIRAEVLKNMTIPKSTQPELTVIDGQS
jgi:recombination protein RecA